MSRLPAMRRALVAGLWMLCCCAAASAAPSPVRCAGNQAAASAEDVASAAALQKTLQAGPLYKMLAATSRRASCRVRFLEAGKFELDYQFGRSTWLHARRDARIEHTELMARFSGALKQPAETLLARAERSSFGPDGCKIDWRESETQAADDDASATETIYRGAVCNCQARIRRNARGRVEGFTLRSAC